MRNGVVSGFAGDTLGPLRGYNETLEMSVGEFPINQYFIGVLAPRDPDDANLVGGGDEALSPLGSEKGKSTGSAEDAEDGGVSGQAGDGFLPKIDPHRPPNNMGMSFTCVHQGERPSFEVAITYATYHHQSSGSKHEWHRKPRAIHFTSDELYKTLSSSTRGMVFFFCKNPNDGELSMNTTNGETALWVNIRPALKTNETIITLMLVNHLERGDKKPWDNEYNQVLVHQPEIRVAFTEGTAFPEPTGLPQLDEYSSEQEYEVRLDEFRYASRSQKGRGHLCSVTWGEFDPQRMSSAQMQDLLVSYSSNGPEEDLARAPPFFWTDGQHPALAAVHDRFRQPDIRTEYLPMVVLPAPEMDPDDKRYWEECPTAETLSSAFTPTEMERQLLPLVKGYEKWIQGELAAAPSSVVQKAQAALERMNDGMDILLNDDTAREAFNIANRAIHLSNQWRNPNRDFRWRKFQLAFALASVESLTNVDSPNRDALDLLWVATGGGKTEAYLLLMAYAIVHRRLQSKHGQNQAQWHGVDVITRYTLRLLTIQQSRRTLGTVTALEYLRNTGWSPDADADHRGEPFSDQPVSLGLWVGTSLTPNQLGKEGRPFRREDQARRADALRVLRHGQGLTDSQLSKFPEPAQILSCPACSSDLAYPTNSTIKAPINNIHWVCYSRDIAHIDIVSICQAQPHVNSATVHTHSLDIITLTLDTDGLMGNEATVIGLWDAVISGVRGRGGQLFNKAMRPGRPGYFPRKHLDRRRNTSNVVDFVIHCPNPMCNLNHKPWSGAMPAGVRSGYSKPNSQIVYAVEGWMDNKGGDVHRGMPIPAYTVDEQIYQKCPSIVVSTVDKFAQLPRQSTGRIGQLFGAVGSYHQDTGFERSNEPSSVLISNFSTQGGLLPPNLIVQDELHLIEGPLGSMVGFYETVIDKLMSEHPHLEHYKPKYVASSATINRGEEQVQCLFNRTTNLFPPKGITWKDRGFIVEKDDEHPSSRGDDKGRLFLGICPIGQSALAAQRDMFSSLLVHGYRAFDMADNAASDRYWTLVGYYNSVRELAGARTLLDFEVQQSIDRVLASRSLPPLTITRPDMGRIVELSGRMESSHLPLVLNNLETRKRGDDGATDVLLSTSMFGTGVDVDRINLMMVTGQPKSTAQYIQAAGRVGRQNGGLIITNLRNSRPRDLDHYERFVGYHAQINRYVEAVTIRPFAVPVLERAAGAVQIAYLRNSRNVGLNPVGAEWWPPEGAHAFSPTTSLNGDINSAMDMIVSRHDQQISERQILDSPPNFIRSTLLEPAWDVWRAYCTNADAVNQELRWQRWDTREQQGVAIRWSVMANEPQVEDDQDLAVFSNEHQTPMSMRTTDGEIPVRTRGEN